MRDAGAHSRVCSAAGPPENATSAAPAPGWPSVPSHVMCIGPSVNESGARSALRQKRFLSAIRHLTFEPICGISVGGSSGSNAIRFQTLGGAVRSTCSASSTRPLASVTRASLSLTCTLRHRHSRHHPLAADGGGQPTRQLLIAALAAIDLAVGPVLLEAAALDHRQVAEIALPLGDHAVVGRHHRVEPGLARAATRRCRRSTPRACGGRAPRRSGVRHGSNASVTFAASAFIVLRRRLELLPERFRRLRRQPLAAEHDRRVRVLLADVEELELELLGVGHPRRVIGSDQLAAALDVLARHEVREAQDAAADAVARLDDGHVVAGPRELVRRGQAAEAGADDDHASRLRLGESAPSRSLSSTPAAAASERCIISRRVMPSGAA